MARKLKINKISNARKFSLKKYYRETFGYLKESDNYIFLVLGFFVLFFSIGFIIPYIAPQNILNPILEAVKNYINDILNKTKDLGFFEMWWFIFSNNSLISLISVFSGFFFGIIPIFLALSNGLFVGLIVGLVISYEGLSSVWQLVPHGIFEIPAVIISFAIGIRFGAFMFSKNPKKSFIYNFKNCLRVFILIIIPLLVIAAVIEAGLIILMK